MHKQSQNINKSEQSESAVKLNTKIKETWTELSDDDIRLYEGKRDRFFSALKEKHHVSKEDAQKKMQQLEKECGCGTAKAA